MHERMFYVTLDRLQTCAAGAAGALAAGLDSNSFSATHHTSTPEQRLHGNSSTVTSLFNLASCRGQQSSPGDKYCWSTWFAGAEQQQQYCLHGSSVGTKDAERNSNETRDTTEHSTIYLPNSFDIYCNNVENINDTCVSRFNTRNEAWYNTGSGAEVGLTPPDCDVTTCRESAAYCSEGPINPWENTDQRTSFPAGTLSSTNCGSIKHYESFLNVGVCPNIATDDDFLFNIQPTSSYFRNSPGVHDTSSKHDPSSGVCSKRQMQSSPSKILQ